MSSKIINKVQSYFFTEDSNKNLQMTKFIVCSVLLVCASYPPKLFSHDLITNFQPIGVFRFLPQITDADYFGWIAGLFRLFLLGAILNFYTRISLIGATLFGIYNLIYRFNFGVVYHGNWLICATLILLAMVPAKAWKSDYKGIHATWPVRLIQIYICMYYTSAGLQKWLRSGFEWAWSENLAIRIYSNKLTPVAEFFMNMDPLVLRTLALSLMIVEMTSLAALTSRRVCYFYMLVWGLMHLGIQMTFSYHIDFLMNIACFAAFINWQAMRTKLSLPRISIDTSKNI